MCHPLFLGWISHLEGRKACEITCKIKGGEMDRISRGDRDWLLALMAAMVVACGGGAPPREASETRREETMAASGDVAEASTPASEDIPSSPTSLSAPEPAARMRREPASAEPLLRAEK